MASPRVARSYVGAGGGIILKHVRCATYTLSPRCSEAHPVRTRLLSSCPRKFARFDLQNCTIPILDNIVILYPRSWSVRRITIPRFNTVVDSSRKLKTCPKCNVTTWVPHGLMLDRFH
uniref:Uncharacterized protein n=1 Tax=Sipha flava TaxID=143950 RepID=A0A2S2QE86_9HEMI